MDGLPDPVARGAVPVGVVVPERVVGEVVDDLVLDRRRVLPILGGRCDVLANVGGEVVVREVCPLFLGDCIVKDCLVVVRYFKLTN